MKVTINGKQDDISEGLTVDKLLAERNVRMPDMVSVELNGDILRRSLFETTSVQEGDKVEFIYFMGGGSGSKSIDRAAGRTL
jgi:sulfur carrier protein